MVPLHLWLWQQQLHRYTCGSGNGSCIAALVTMARAIASLHLWLWQQQLHRCTCDSGSSSSRVL